MPRIVAVEEIPEDRKRRRIVFSGAEPVELSLEVALGARFLPGRTVSAGQVRRAVREDELKTAEQDALRLLRVKDRSEAELRRELRRRGHAEGTVAATIEKCRGWGYLDDKRLAERIVSEGVEHKHLGPARVKRTLRERGISDKVASSTLSKSDAGKESLVEQALLALGPKMRSYARLEPEVAKRRMIGFLGRRGYDYETIKEALERAGRAIGNEADSS